VVGARARTGSGATLRGDYDLGDWLREARAPGRLDAITRELTQRFEREQAVMVVDMCGLTDMTQHSGVVHALALVQYLRDTGIEAIQPHGGVLVETVADDLLCVFPDVGTALDSAGALAMTLEAHNATADPQWKMNVSIGVGHGPILNVDDRWIAGAEVNLASKLGEDVAEAGELLLTLAAWTELGRPEKGWSEGFANLGSSTIVYRRGMLRSLAAK
jgi:adenylate cyclase